MVGPKRSNSFSETNHFMEVEEMYPLIYRRLFHNVSLWEKVFLGPIASRDVIITQFGHYVKLTSKSGTLLQGFGQPLRRSVSSSCDCHVTNKMTAIPFIIS